jgi:hypothetical protein
MHTPPEARAFDPNRELSNLAVPTADTVLLVFLLSVLLFIVTAGWIVHSLAQPTVLINAGVASFEREKRVPIILSSPYWQDAEQSAVALALRENEQHGLQLLVVANPSEQHKPPPIKIAKVAAARPPKVKRAVKDRRHYARPYWRDAWAYAPHGNAFGSWWR